MVKSGIALSIRKTVCFIHWREIYPADCFNNLLVNRGLGQNVKNPQIQLNLVEPLLRNHSLFTATRRPF